MAVVIVRLAKWVTARSKARRSTAQCLRKNESMTTLGKIGLEG